MKTNERKSGILLHPTSLPSPYGIGDLGKDAFQFVDFLEDAGMHLWQILPLTHTGFGDSPYQSFSAFAGQPLLISPDHLVKLGLLDIDDLSDCPSADPTKVEYGTIVPWKTKIHKIAYTNFLTKISVLSSLNKEFQTFCQDQAFWLDDYALFLALKDLHNGKSWQEWDEVYKTPTASLKKELMEKYAKEAGYYQFLQFIFFQEWNEVKAYANARNIQIIGDIPIFVSMDSADVWANQQLFQLDSKGHPLAVAGVPPDYFSETGQLWGNPLYSWEAHKEDGFSWWISRIESQLKILDILRIDHFLGLASYWSIPYGEKTAINGKRVKAPGDELFTAIQNALGNNLPIIAEDLGTVTKEAEALRLKFNFPGMKVLQFAFESTDESNYLPHQYTDTNCVCYTGTHDNDTTIGWFKSAKKEYQKKVLAYSNSKGEKDIAHDLIRLCLGSIAKYAIFPMQDALCYGTEGRMNTPGIAAGNWGWRYEADELTGELSETLKRFNILYGRNLAEKTADKKEEVKEGVKEND